jgi:uncharacterized membrane protein
MSQLDARTVEPEDSGLEAKQPAGRYSEWSVSAALVFLLGIALRLIYINHESVGFDESFSLTRSRLPLGEMMAQLIRDYVQPPLYYFALRGWFQLVGFGVLQARLLSAVFSALAIPALYLLARYLFDRRTAVLAALLLAVSQLTIMLGQEPRPYAQFLLLVLLSCYFFLRALREGRAAFWWAFVGSAIPMIYTSYFGGLAIAALSAHAAIYRKRYRLPLGWVLKGAGIAAAAYLPWLASGIFRVALRDKKAFSADFPFWHSIGSMFFSALNFFNNGKTAGLRDPARPWTFLAGGLLFTLPLAWGCRRVMAARNGAASQREREGLVFAGLLWLPPLVLVIGMVAFQFRYEVRYVAFCAAPYYILAARGILELRPRVLRWGLVALILAYSANALRTNYSLRWKQDFRGALTYVDSSLQPGDCGMFLPFGSPVPDQYVITQAGRPSFRVMLPEEGTSQVASCGRVWTISHAIAGDEGPWRIVRAPAGLEMGFARVAERLYYGVRVDLYSRKEGSLVP